MAAHIYKQTKRINLRKPLRFVGLALIIAGLLFGLYTISPLFFWELYLKPAFASNTFASPIPHSTVLATDTLRSLWATSLKGGYWLPTYNGSKIDSNITSYSLTIPKLKITNATVSTIDTDVNNHLVHFPGTAIAPDKGSAVVFGHSTLPHLYDPKNYKTIFANLHTLSVNDKLLLTINNTIYTYYVTSITVVDAEDTSYLAQQTDDSYFILVTCTPPGTIWKRLVIKSSLEKIEK